MVSRAPTESPRDDARPAAPAPPDPRAKWGSLGALACGELLAMALWFSASAVVPQLTAEWSLDPGEQAWLTMAVQIGFVAGALASALLNLPDRFDLLRLIGGSAAVAALANGAILLCGPRPWAVILLRAATGAALAGVYPPGMKLVATWCREDRGLGIGILVGALTLGSASPHLLNALPLLGAGGMPPWRTILATTSLMALAGAAIVVFGSRKGPYLGTAAPFDWRHAARGFSDRPTRLANFGYLGHMWELYAMWTWAPLLLIKSYERAGWSLGAARLAGFGAIAAGALGCVVAGRLADRLGRTLVAGASLLVSGACAVAAGGLFDRPGPLTILALVWGFAVVADSAQFSAATSELSDPRYVGTALTVQTSAGFLLTLVSIRLVPHLVASWGWERVFAVLAVGPAFGLWCMLRLRGLPEASRLASGNR